MSTENSSDTRPSVTAANNLTTDSPEPLGDAPRESEASRRRENEGLRLTAELTKLRSDLSQLDVWPWRNPFTYIHSSALHEAGHAVIAVALGRQLLKLTVLQDAAGAGAVEREFRENTPKEIVEEIFIAYGGCEAADLYRLVTNGIYDRQRVDNLKAKRPDMVAVSDEAARTSVRKALTGFRRALEDVAVGLFSAGELTGEAATKLIKDAMSDSSESIERVNKDIDRLARKRAVLVVGWGPDGCKDVDDIVNSYSHDQSLYCVKAPSADSRDVLTEVENWLTGHADAQILCLGMHGTPTGLQPTEESGAPKITYSELGRAIKRNFCGNLNLTIFLGACESDHAADVWNTLTSLPIKLLIAFSGKERIKVIREALEAFLPQGDLCVPGKIEVPKNIDFWEEDIQSLRSRYPSIRIYYKPDEALQLTEASAGGNQELKDELQRKGQVQAGTALTDAALKATMSEPERQSSETNIAPIARSRVTIQTVGPSVLKKRRSKRRK